MGDSSSTWKDAGHSNFEQHIDSLSSKDDKNIGHFNDDGSESSFALPRDIKSERSISSSSSIPLKNDPSCKVNGEKDSQVQNSGGYL